MTQIGILRELDATDVDGPVYVGGVEFTALGLVLEDHTPGSA
jgi:hypothetical protein